MDGYLSKGVVTLIYKGQRKENLQYGLLKVWVEEGQIKYTIVTDYALEEGLIPIA